MSDTYMRPEQEARERGQLEGRIARAEQERALALQQKKIAIAEKEEALQENRDLKNKLRADRTYFMGEIRKANERRVRSVKKPMAVLIVCALAFILAQVGVEAHMVHVIVGGTLSAIALCAAFFCGGVVWGALRWREK